MKNYEEILEQLNVDQFTVWKPQIGDSLVGEIIAWTNFTHHAYGLQDAMLVDTPTGRVSVALNQYLKTGLRNGKARIGSLIATLLRRLRIKIRYKIQRIKINHHQRGKQCLKMKLLKLMLMTVRPLG